LGGITPDETVEAPKLDRFQTELSRDVLFTFTRHYFGRNNSSLPKGWMPDESTLNELRAYMKQRGTNFSEEDITKHRDWILRNLAREMYTTAFNVDVAEQMFARTDSLVEKAVDSMPKATALVETAKKVIAQRMNSQQQQQPAQGTTRRR
jgi:predicted unusual protein kinase regulating ubiquinone biosynthesis (AarF/ABC1/UbiB family)